MRKYGQAGFCFNQALVLGANQYNAYLNTHIAGTKTGSNQARETEVEEWLHPHHLLCCSESHIPTYHVFKSEWVW